MKNNRGFTLVELLAILVILGIIALLAIPNISKQIDSNEKKESLTLKKSIENASKLYVAKYYADKLITCTDDPCPGISFSLIDLENDGLLNLKSDQCTLKDPTKNKEDYKIEVKYSNPKIENYYQQLDNGFNNCYSTTP